MCDSKGSRCELIEQHSFVICQHNQKYVPTTHTPFYRKRTNSPPTNTHRYSTATHVLFKLLKAVPHPPRLAPSHKRRTWIQQQSLVVPTVASVPTTVARHTQRVAHTAAGQAFHCHVPHVTCVCCVCVHSWIGVCVWGGGCQRNERCQCWVRRMGKGGRLRTEEGGEMRGAKILKPIPPTCVSQRSSVWLEPSPH